MMVNEAMNAGSPSAVPSDCPAGASGISGAGVAEQLQDLVLDSLDVADFLLELAEYSAALASPDRGESFECAITLYRRRKSLTGAGNTARAKNLNQIQSAMGQGPCLSAMEELGTMVISETARDGRWPEYGRALLKENIHSVLAVPLALEQGAAASINFFSSTPHAFTEPLVHAAEQYAAQARKSLLLAVRIGSKQELADDLQEAMKSRTAIDLAVGVIMGQQRCSQTAAFELLTRAASTRNQKLRKVAVDLLAKVTDEGIQTRFDA